MPSLNTVLLMGNLTRDPEIKYTPKGTAIAEIGLAINHNYTTDSGEKREEVTFVDVTFWGKQAETIGKYCKKGHPLFVEGRLQLDSWDDKQTGQKQYRMRVIGNGFQFLGGKRDEGGEHTERPNLATAPQKRPDPDLDDAPEDDIPFNREAHNPR